MKKCSASFSQFRILVLEAVYGATIKLRRYIVLNITTKVISKVAKGMRDVENVGNNQLVGQALGDPQGR